MRNAPVEMDAAEFRRLGRRMVDDIADYLGTLRERPVTPAETPATVRQALHAAKRLPETGTDAEQLLEQAFRLMVDHSLFNGHPRFFGYITSSPSPLGALGDLLASAVNQNVSAWKLAPMATEIEAQTIRWIADLIGFPDDCGGLLVSGGNMANFVSFLAARSAKAGWNVRKDGLRGPGQPLRVYVSSETHTWIQKAADFFGLGTDAIRWINTDGEQRMDPSALQRQIEADAAAGMRPFLVVGTAGTVSTGAVDPLPEIAEICRRFDLWFHVDGAYGAPAAQVPGTPPALQAIREADSVAVDPHKWLYAPLEAGCVLVRDAKRLRDAFSYRPPYYILDDEVLNYVDYGPQNSRGFRALKVWLGLQQTGRAGALQMIADDMALSRRLYASLSAHPEFETLTQSLSIATFRYVPSDLRKTTRTAETEAYLDRLNRELLMRVGDSGQLFLSNAMVGSIFALRACITNFRTSEEDVDALPELVSAMGREIDSERHSLSFNAEA